jgi:cysteine desulfurase
MHIVSTAIEHKAVLEPLAHLAGTGFEVTTIVPDRDGYIDPADVLKAVRDDTLLVSVMHANNETGILQPISAIAEGLPSAPNFHVDAAQAFGRETATLRNRRIDLVSLSGHKTFAPKGIGALIARRREGRRIPLTALMHGGGQERGLRPGTLPVPLVAGFGLAVELAENERAQRRETCLQLRRRAVAAFGKLDAIIHGSDERGVLPNILSVAIPGLDSEAIMVALKHHVAISNGSACTSASYSPSHVLTAMGLSRDEIDGTIRLSWSHQTGYVPWDGIIAILDRLRLPFGLLD